MQGLKDSASLFLPFFRGLPFLIDLSSKTVERQHMSLKPPELPSPTASLYNESIFSSEMNHLRSKCSKLKHVRLYTRWFLKTTTLQLRDGNAQYFVILFLVRIEFH